VKVTGPCNENFVMFLVPHIYIEVDTEDTYIELRTSLRETDNFLLFESNSGSLEKEKYVKEESKDTTSEKTVQAQDEPTEVTASESSGSSSSGTVQSRNSSQGTVSGGSSSSGNANNSQVSSNSDSTKKSRNLHNICEKGKTFKFVVYIKENTLILKWKVYGEPKDNQVDVRKYMINEKESPITSILIHAYKEHNETNLIESKNYVLRSDVPEKCDALASNCFLSGNFNIEKCFQCALLVEPEKNKDECFKYLSEDIRNKFTEIKAETEDDDEDDYTEYKLTESIDNILIKMFKTNEKNEKSELIKLEEVDDSLKLELMNYCSLLKDVDTSGTLDNYEMGNEMDIFNNLKRLLIYHSEENINTLKNKFRNAAVCLKNVDDWIVNKRGLVLPEFNYDLEYFNEDLYNDKNSEEDNNNKEKGVINVNKNVEKENSLSYDNTNNMFCNKEYCNRLKDENNCISKLEVEDQGNCDTSWIFASKYHLETIRCMKGYEPTKISALYVANCYKGEHKDRCDEGSSPIEFLQIIEDYGFLPKESNYPYNYVKVGEQCPNVQDYWVNLWDNTKVLTSKNEPNSLDGKGYTAYESEKFQDNMEAFINIIKTEVMNKGSVIAYIKAENVMGYEFSGKKVQNLCGDDTADHAVNIVGYGNYMNNEGEKKSYWIVRNSWGPYWGDEGYFKVDMHGPTHCHFNFIHSVVIFNLDLPMNNKTTKKESKIYDYYLKASPDFYHNLYFKNFNVDNKKLFSEKEDNENNKKLSNNYIIFGQDTERSEETSDGKSDPSGSAQNVSSQASGESGQANSVSSGSEQSGSSKASVESEQGSSLPSVSEQEGSNPASERVHVYHVLKHIKDSKIRMALRKYMDTLEVGKRHSCTRAYAFDQDNYEKCVQFCNDNWKTCENKASPGHCLSKLETNKECYFCYV
ncbi:serine repeat antigen 5, partial [Plasmodium gaboni]